MVYSSRFLLDADEATETRGVRLVRWTAGLLLCALVAAAIAGARAAAGPYPGVYEGNGNGVKVELRVSDRGEGALRYAMRSECGVARGRIDLGAPRNGGFAGKRVSAGPHRALRKTTVRVSAVGDGTALRGTIADSLRGTKASDPCQAKRKFKAELGKSEAFIPARDEGHYTGASASGLPISFDVVGDPGSGQARIANLTADVAGDCLDIDFLDELTTTVHIRGLEGAIERSGEVDLEIVDVDSEFDVYGEIADGVAELEIWIDAYFGPTGLPDPFASLYCDNEGAAYVARRS